MEITCNKCQTKNLPTDTQCVNCGTSITSQHKGISRAYEMKIYIFSFLLAPFGLYWVFKFWKSDIEKNRKVAKRALLITLLLIIASLLMGFYYVSLVKKEMEIYRSSYEVLL